MSDFLPASIAADCSNACLAPRPQAAESAECRLCGARLGPRSAQAPLDYAPMPVYEVRFREGQLLYLAGQRGDVLFVLRRGLVKETIVTDEAERVVRLVGAGGATGLAAVLGQPHRHCATVIGSGSGCRIPVQALHRVFRADPGAALEFLPKWQGALDDADRSIAAFSSGPARARLARLILYLTSSLGTAAKLRRREAAELIGVTPVSVTRLIGEFKREGLVRENGSQLAAWDEDGLMKLAGGARRAGGAPGGGLGEPALGVAMPAL